ncbi:hypothetical protein G5V59_14655 [Nocardioides sp. W3-2-3]|uniref:hypothetical protein n=1 Tax=Nocardioides convexus TaxID=2712224 RepID=UPI00241849B6|nr:hypothetical protein [Nocardioides convexus]NHA00777.1 hypothetical protein [Nocardioides convexus]
MTIVLLSTVRSSLMETVTRVQVFKAGWVHPSPMAALCTQDIDSSVYLRWEGERSLAVISPSGKTMATVEIGRDGAARVTSPGRFHDC